MPAYVTSYLIITVLKLFAFSGKSKSVSIESFAIFRRKSCEWKISKENNFIINRMIIRISKDASNLQNVIHLC